MALTTGTPVGNVLTQEELFIEGAPTIYIQDWEAGLLNNPDANSFYWGMSGTATYPVYEVACVSDVSFTEDVTVNDVLCDSSGVKDTIQQRNSVSFAFAVKSLFPILNMAQLLNFGSVTQSGSQLEQSGIGPINNNRFWHVWAPKVYDDDVGDYIAIWMHKAKFVEAWTIDMTFGDAWTANGIQLRAFTDSFGSGAAASAVIPSAQSFGSWLRLDPSAIA
jgi:hypothetical protein